MRYLRRIFGKSFWVTLLIKQNKYHRFGVFRHTIAVFLHNLKDKNYKMLPAALLHDIAKPFSAFQDENDILTGEYSFHNHEEFSYKIIKNWPISEYTKNLVRYHYIIRAMQKATQKNKILKYQRLQRKFDKLDPYFINDLKTFMKYDDLGK